MTKQNTNAFRHELKYSINPSEDFALTSRLRKLFRHDVHADSHGSYRVSSLYFDSLHDLALREKIDGVNMREKFRLRYYNTDLSFIRLEKKQKIQGMSLKFSARLTLEEALSLTDGDYGFLAHSEDPLLLEFYTKLKTQFLKPQTVVTYNREAFTYLPGNVRITLDRQLRSGLRRLDFFNPSLPHMPVHDELTVLELKYDRFLPDLVRLAVQTPNRHASSNSKYAICRRYD